MSNYETVVVFSSRFSESELKDEIKKIETLIQNNKGSITEVKPWGKKELPHAVRKEKLGNFVGFHFASDDSDTVSGVASVLRISEAVLKFQTHRLSDRVRKFKGSIRKRPTEGREEGVGADF